MRTEILVDVDAFDLAGALAESCDVSAETINEIGRALKEDVRETWVSHVAPHLDAEGSAIIKALAAKLGG